MTGLFGFTWAQLRKFLIAVVGFSLTVLATALAVGPEVIPVEWLPWVHISLAVGASYGVYRIKNATTN